MQQQGTFIAKYMVTSQWAKSQLNSFWTISIEPAIPTLIPGQKENLTASLSLVPNNKMQALHLQWVEMCESYFFCPHMYTVCFKSIDPNCTCHSWATNAVHYLLLKAYICLHHSQHSPWPILPNYLSFLSYIIIRGPSEDLSRVTFQTWWVWACTP